MKYVRRTIEAHLPRLRSQYPVLTITGPRQSGKTSLVKHHFRDLPFVNLESREERAFAREDPKGFLARFADGAILDEIQHVPELTSWIQVLVDERQRNGMFVLTGSRQFQVMEAVSQSLAGRTVMIQLLPFSLEELSVAAAADDLLLRGFYPRIWDQRLDPVEALSSYLTTYVERDVRQLTQVHNLALFERFLGLCAGRIGQVLNLSTLANDTGISQPTATQWMTILEASYIVYRLRPYHANLGKRLIKSPKLYFYDVGLAARLLEIEHGTHLRRHPLRGKPVRESRRCGGSQAPLSPQSAGQSLLLPRQQGKRDRLAAALRSHPLSHRGQVRADVEHRLLQGIPTLHRGVR